MATLAGVDRRLLVSQGRMEEVMKGSEAAQVRAESAEENIKLLQQALEYSEQKLAGRDSELGKVRAELAKEASERARLEAELIAERAGRAAEAEDLRAELMAEREKVKAAGGQSYLGHVKQFLKTFLFKKLLNMKAAPSFKMGFEECSSAIGEGVPFEASKHGWGAYVAAKIQERESAQATPSAPTAEGAAPEVVSEFEVPMEELLSEDEATPAGGAESAEEDSSDEEGAAGGGGAEEEAARTVSEDHRPDGQASSPNAQP